MSGMSDAARNRRCEKRSREALRQMQVTGHTWYRVGRGVSHAPKHCPNRRRGHRKGRVNRGR